MDSNKTLINICQQPIVDRTPSSTNRILARVLANQGHWQKRSGLRNVLSRSISSEFEGLDFPLIKHMEN
jgi:hypothetical protein